MSKTNNKKYKFKTPKMVFDHNKCSMKFYYDTMQHKDEGEIYPIKKNMNGNVSWMQANRIVKKIEFDKSFRKYKPESTKKWFDKCSFLKHISGLENLNTDNVVDMSGMFRKCIGITNLDLNSFNYNNCKSTKNMFLDCYCLQFVNMENLNISKIDNKHSMFENCFSLRNLKLANMANTNFNDRTIFKSCCLLNAA